MTVHQPCLCPGLVRVVLAQLLHQCWLPTKTAQHICCFHVGARASTAGLTLGCGFLASPVLVSPVGFAFGGLLLPALESCGVDGGGTG